MQLDWTSMLLLGRNQTKQSVSIWGHYVKFKLRQKSSLVTDVRVVVHFGEHKADFWGAGSTLFLRPSGSYTYVYFVKTELDTWFVAFFCEYAAVKRHLKSRMKWRDAQMQSWTRIRSWSDVLGMIWEI